MGVDDETLRDDHAVPGGLGGPVLEASTRVRRRPALTREQVFVAALRLIDVDGVSALSMCRLGKALDRDPVRLYCYAPSKDSCSTAWSNSSSPA